MLNTSSGRGRGLLFTCICIALLGSFAFAGPAGAQQEESEELERLEITGSRIRGAAQGTAPVMTIERDEILQTGLSSVADVLQEMTTGGSALNTKLNSSGNFGFPPTGEGIGAGAATVDLRHLGANRVLVLVDGLRWVNETSASGVSSVVDLNTIPVAMIERIEVLEDGASSIYGSDAIAGVVNVITRKDAEGAFASAQYGEYDEGDGETWNAEFSVGGRIDRLSYFFSASAMEQKAIESGDRDMTRFPVPGTGVTRGSSGTPQGRFIFLHPSAPEGLCPETVCDVTTPPGTSQDFIDFPGGFQQFGGDDRFNFSPFNFLLTPNERQSFFAQFEYELTDRVSLWGRGLHTERDSTNRAAPEPIFLGPEAGTGGIADGVSIHETNPYNPFGFTLDPNDNFLLLGRRPLEGGPRIFEQNVTTRYLAGGVRGDFDVGERQYFWDVNVVDTRNKASETTHGSYNIARIAQALGPLDECEGAANGCVPLNLFGGVDLGQLSSHYEPVPGTITQEMLDFITFVGVNVSEQEMTQISGNLSGDIVELPAGMMSFAAGYEYRDHSGFFEPDSVIVAGESNGVPALPTSGGFDVSEFYGELRLPLLAELPGVYQLDLTGALRYSDYETFGGESTGKLGLRWAVTEDFLIRGTFAEGLRAPSIGELFGSASRFDAVLDDPCSNFPASGDPTVIANCQALGVPENFEQVNPQISITTGGNEELDPETSESYTFGFVYNPLWVDRLSWAERLRVAMTFYRHEIEGAIRAFDAQTQLDECVRTLDDEFCAGIGRAATGAINRYDNQLINIGGIDTEGFDINLGYTGPDTAAGRFDVTWNSTFVNEYEESLPGGLIRDLRGVEANDSGIPKWQSNLIVNWRFNDWGVNWTARYLSALRESCSDFLDGTALSFTSLGLCSHPAADDEDSVNRLGSTVYHNAQVTWQPQINRFGLTLTGGVRNVFDRDPPTCLSCSLNGFDVTLYELPGRFWYVRAGVDF